MESEGRRRARDGRVPRALRGPDRHDRSPAVGDRGARRAGGARRYIPPPAQAPSCRASPPPDPRTRDLLEPDAGGPAAVSTNRAGAPAMSSLDRLGGPRWAVVGAAISLVAAI